MINYGLPKFKKGKKKYKDNIFGILTISVLVSFLAGVIGSDFFYNQMENSFAQLVQNKAEQECSCPVPRSTQSEDVVGIVENVSPAVVSIVAKKEVPVYKVESGQGYFFPSYRKEGTKEQKVSEGTGFIISEDGIVLTNKHVVLKKDVNYEILTSDGSEYSAEVVARDPIQDLAVLEMKDTDKKFSTVKLGNSDEARVGQTVIAIGNALGKYQNAVSVGVVSGLGRTIQASGGTFYEELKNVIQTDAAINKGNSGGPLLNLSGEVIGINTAVDIEGQNIAFAIPINKAKKDVKQIRKEGKITYPFLGVRYVAIDKALQKEQDLSVDYGSLILKGPNGEPAVISGSGADKAGIQRGDIILKFNGQKIDSDHGLGEEIMKYSPDQEVSITILRDGEKINTKATLTERDL